jgi:hypothetical protein
MGTPVESVTLPLTVDCASAAKPGISNIDTKRKILDLEIKRDKFITDHCLDRDGIL